MATYHDNLRIVNCEQIYSIEDRIATSIEQIKEKLHTQDVRVEYGKGMPFITELYVNGTGHPIMSLDKAVVMLALEFFIRGLNHVEDEAEDAENFEDDIKELES